MPRADYEYTIGTLSKLADDEPIFVLRAQDLTAPAIVNAIASMYRAMGVNNPPMIEKALSADQTAEAMERWEGDKKFPD